MFVLLTPGDNYYISYSEVYSDSRFVASQSQYSPFINDRLTENLCRGVFNRYALKLLPSVARKMFYPRLMGAGKLNKEESHVFFFSRGNRFYNDTAFLSAIRKRYPNVKIVMFLGDLLSRNPNSSVEEQLSLFREYYDLVVTFDPVEAEKYKFSYIPSFCYSRIDKYINESGTFDYDVIYVGRAKVEFGFERFQKIIALFERLRSCDLRLKFYITGVPEEMQIYKDQIIYNQYIPYEKILELISRSRCILEIMQADQTGTTMRTSEAIAYNKRLLTDNESLRSYELYDAKNMLIFQSAEEIDVNFILDDSPIIYHGFEKLSPYLYFDKVTALLNDKNK